jgi:hypothetical protein
MKTIFFSHCLCLGSRYVSGRSKDWLKFKNPGKAPYPQGGALLCPLAAVREG